MSAAAAHMDRMYRHQRHIYDASRKFYLLGRDDLIRELQPPAGGSILEIGCGTARNLTLAARTYPSARCYGFDVSEQMLTTARRSIETQGLSGRVSVGLADAARVDPRALFGVSAFDRVFVSYALSMMPPWREALDRAFDLVAPSGSLHIVDFGGFEELPQWFGRGVNRWLGAFSVTPRLELPAALQEMSSPRGMTPRLVKRFRGYALHAVVVANGARAGVDAHGPDFGLNKPPKDRRAAGIALPLGEQSARLIA